MQLIWLIKTTAAFIGNFIVCKIIAFVVKSQYLYILLFLPHPIPYFTSNIPFIVFKLWVGCIDIHIEVTGHMPPCPSPENHWQHWQKSSLLSFLLNTNYIFKCNWVVKLRCHTVSLCSTLYYSVIFQCIVGFYDIFLIIYNWSYIEFRLVQ